MCPFNYSPQLSLSAVLPRNFKLFTPNALSLSLLDAFHTAAHGATEARGRHKRQTRWITWCTSSRGAREEHTPHTTDPLTAVACMWDLWIRKKLKISLISRDSHDWQAPEDRPPLPTRAADHLAERYALSQPNVTRGSASFCTAASQSKQN